MKIALLTITWRRPALLGRLIECFCRQTHPDREMIILDDGDDYPDQPQGDRWRIISVNRRFRSLGSKRNACAAMASPDVGGFLIMDDDDFLFPWGMAATSRALENSPWAQPRAAFEWTPDGDLIRQETFGRRRPHYVDYHSGWSYRRQTFEEVRGYPIVGEEDTALRDQLVDKHGPGGDTICQEFPEPFVIYGTPGMVYRISYLYNAFRGQEMHAKTWSEAANMPPQGEFTVGWDRDYLAIPRPTTTQLRPW
jgi:glycosyltransferase involved in cell wall biosynthesis